jgi:hypothetical protein
MEEGYVLDIGYGTVTTSSWVEGPPQKSRWSGLVTKGRRKLPVTVYRCSKCGFLESWATGVA